MGSRAVVVALALAGCSAQDTATTPARGRDAEQVAAAAVAPADARPAAETPQADAKRRDHPPPPRGVRSASRPQFPDVTLTTHDGKQVRFYKDLIEGKTVVINFMYATCTGT